MSTDLAKEGAQDIATTRAELIAAGFQLLPVRANSKVASVEGWNVPGKRFGLKPHGNAGIFTGTHRDGGALLVLDVDIKSDCDGEASLRALEDAHGTLPLTREHATPSGGRHIIFRVPEAVPSSAGKLGCGLDVRSADGYIVAPSSIFDGKPYTVACGGEIAEAPQWLVELCGERRERDPEADKPLPGIDRTRAEQRAIEYLKDVAPVAVQYDGGDATTFRVAAHVKDLGVSADDCVALMLEHWNDRCAPPWAADELQTKAANAYHYGKERQGADAPEAIFGAEPLPAVPRDERTEPRLQLVSIRDIESATLAEPRFIVERIIPAAEVTLLGGHGGSGKSILALSIAAHVAAGADAWAGLSIERGPALFVSLEDRGDFVRWRNVEKGLRVIDGTAASALMAETFHDGSTRIAETPSMRELRALVQDAGLIVIDNASDAFDGNENARRQVRAFVQTLKGLGRTNDAAVLLLAHIDKSAARYGAGGNSYSGSSAWHNSARSRLAIIEGDGEPPTLHHEKANMGPKIAPMRMEWTSNGVLMPAATVPGRTTKDDADAVLHAVAVATDKGEDVAATMGALHIPQKVLESFGLPPWLAGKPGRRAFEGAIRALLAENRLTIDKYQNASRQMKKRLRVAGPVGLQVPDFDAA